MVDNKCVKNILENESFLKLLTKSNKKLRNSIIDGSNKALITVICDCIYNTLNGKVNLSNDEKLHLSKHKRYLRQMISKNTLKKKKHILKQHGGFLQFLIPAIIEGLTTVLLK